MSSHIEHHSIPIRDASRAARLTLPRDGAEVVPAIVFVHGSGTSDETAFQREAERFAERGIAFLTVAKVMDGYTSTRRDYASLANDVAQAAAWLRSHPGIDPERIGLIGISEGGWVATIAAAAYPEYFGFLILESAAVVSPGEQMHYHHRSKTREAALFVRLMHELTARITVRLCNYRNFDSAPWLATISQPIYAVWGADDRTIPISRANAHLRKLAGGRVTMRIIRGQGHYLNPDLPWLDEIATWVHTIPRDGD